MTVEKNTAVSAIVCSAVKHCLSTLHTYPHVCFLNGFGTHSLISVEIIQKDLDLKDDYVSIHSVEI